MWLIVNAGPGKNSGFYSKVYSEGIFQSLKFLVK